MTDMGEVTRILGMEVKHDYDQGIILRVDPGGGDGLFRSVPSNVESCRGYIHNIPL